MPTVAYPNTAICKTRLDQHGEHLLSPDGSAALAEVAEQHVSFPPVLSH